MFFRKFYVDFTLYTLERDTFIVDKSVQTIK